MLQLLSQEDIKELIPILGHRVKLIAGIKQLKQIIDKAFPTEEQEEVLPHPPYSSDIAPFDYHLFQSMAHALSEQRFTSYEDTKNWVDLWIITKIRSSSDLESERCLKDRKK
ncbi:Mariner Mos1 transposase [Eumeta japonica]|uniref:Mariner Mos1 transposase n=1 Tax=Eumeta variegata TaxID=151549 RepID=A0A4C1UNB3_EUMVA|nr:Mariner Mos1 transposase [Eumeta japonica]